MKRVMGLQVLSEKVESSFEPDNPFLLQISRDPFLNSPDYTFYRIRERFRQFYYFINLLVEKSRKIEFIEKRGKIVHRFLILTKRSFKTQKVHVLVTSESHQKREGPFLRLGMFLSNVQKAGYLFCGWKRCSQKCEKGAFKKRAFSSYQEGILNPTGWTVSKVLALFYEYFGLNPLPTSQETNRAE